MLRRFLLYLSAARWARGIVTHFWLARRVARRFVAGETLDEAAAACRDLNARGLLVTMDYLGESVTNAAEAEAVRAMYCCMIERIQQDQLQASVSLKLTHLGLDINEALCFNNLRQILMAAQAAHIAVTIDMESSAYTDVTLRLYRKLRDEYGFSNVGTVIQSMLRRSREDMRALAQEGARIRLVKGAYLEPSDIAYPDKADVDSTFVTIIQEFMPRCPPAKLEIASHDEKMIAAALPLIQQRQIAADHYEFQMLYGIRSARQTELAAQGYPVRVYVPFGEAWYPYFMRRLAERPANLWFFVRGLFQA